MGNVAWGVYRTGGSVNGPSVSGHMVESGRCDNLCGLYGPECADRQRRRASWRHSKPMFRVQIGIGVFSQSPMTEQDL